LLYSDSSQRLVPRDAIAKKARATCCAYTHRLHLQSCLNGSSKQPGIIDQLSHHRELSCFSVSLCSCATIQRKLWLVIFTSSRSLPLSIRLNRISRPKRQHIYKLNCISAPVAPGESSGRRPQ
jgi:hypothetical protein